jgi:hypothetical protein
MRPRHRGGGLKVAATDRFRNLDHFSSSNSSPHLQSATMLFASCTNSPTNSSSSFFSTFELVSSHTSINTEITVLKYTHTIQVYLVTMSEQQYLEQFIFRRTRSGRFESADFCELVAPVAEFVLRLLTVF